MGIPAGIDLLDLLEENVKLRKQLESLEKDYEAWDRTGEEDDLEDITALVKKLEEDISRTMGDFNTYHQAREDQPIQEDFHHAFTIMSDLFKDLKRVREELENAFVQSEEIQKLEIDWAKLKKNFDSMEKHYNTLRHGKDQSFF
jgi:DNA mismatch repair ATPase MutS